MNAEQKAVRIIASIALALLIIFMFGMHERARAAGMLVADGGFGGILEIQQLSVDVTVNNRVAVTRITQVFKNTESRQVEALFTFPVPKGGLGLELQHVDKRQGDGRRSTPEGARAPDLRQLQGKAQRSGHAGAEGLPHL